MTTISLTWLVASIFILHDFEEIIFMQRWLERNQNHLLNRIPKRLHNYVLHSFPKSTAGFSVAVVTEYIGILVSTCLAVFVGQRWFILVLSVVTILFLHCFTHMGQTILLRRYTPGVVTAILLMIPFSLYFFSFVLTHRVASWNDVFWSVPIGVLLLIVLNQGGLLLGKWLETRGASVSD